MNLEKVFEFIKEKRGYDYPVIYKLLNGLPLSEDELTIDGDLDLTNTNITSLPDNLKVGGDLVLENSKITSLPDNLQVGGDLVLENSKITSFPDNLYVGEFLDIRNTKINTIPDNLYVGGYLYLNYTPLSKRYSKEEIREMIEDMGGYLGGNIFM